jgi:hypothetical protein
MRQRALKGRQHGSTLVWAHHDLYGVFYVPPLVGLFDLTFLLATQRILSRMGDGRGAMPFKHLPGDGVDLNFRRHRGPPSKIEPSPRQFTPVFDSSRTTEPPVSFLASLCIASVSAVQRPV